MIRRKGGEWKKVLKDFLKYKKEYDKLPQERQEYYSREKSIGAGKVTGRLRSRSMGVLLVNISQGMELDTAVKKYEAMVAPANYKRPKGIYTKRMLEEAGNPTAQDIFAQMEQEIQVNPGRFNRVEENKMTRCPVLSGLKRRGVRGLEKRGFYSFTNVSMTH